MSPRARAIINEVSQRTGVSYEDMRGLRRDRRVIEARFEAIALLREVVSRGGGFAFTLPQIGVIFNRDHTSILNAVRRWEKVGPGIMAKVVPTKDMSDATLLRLRHYHLTKAAELQSALNDHLASVVLADRLMSKLEAA